MPEEPKGTTEVATEETTPGESSASKVDIETTEKTEAATGADQQKASDKGELEETEELPKGFASHPKWQKLLVERNDARTKLDEISSRLEEFNRVTSSPSYIRESMKAQGYKDEAINAKLKELGHEITSKPVDDFSLVAEKLNLDPSAITAEGRAQIQDIATVARIIAEDMIGKKLPSALDPLAKDVSTIKAKDSAARIAKEMRQVVEDEGVLDFEQDIEPAIQKFLNENKNATQQDIVDYFEHISRKLSFERLKKGGKKMERDEKKGESRPNIETSSKSKGEIERPKDFETNPMARRKYLDKLADSLGIK